MRSRTPLLVVALLAALLVPASSATAADSGVRRVLLNATADPATSQYVSWSRGGVSRGQSVVAIAPDGTTHRATAVRKLGTTERTAGSVQYRYVAKLTGLRADTTYRYRITTRKGVTSWRSFRTAPGPHDTLTFLQFGDTQIDNAGVPEDIVDAATKRFDHARLLLLAGDVVDRPWKGGEWTALHRALSPSGQSANWMASIGNHEQCDLLTSCRSGDGRGFRSYFQGANNRFEKQRRTWFFADAGPARFIVLDSFGSDPGRQRAFLREALKTNTRPWSIVLMHSGPFASRGDRTHAAMREAFLPTFEKYGADLVLSGHDHSYARGSKAGVVYLTSVSGPKYYDTSAADWERGAAVRAKAAYRTSTYQAITVTPTEIAVRAIVGHRGAGATPATKVGQVLDCFTLIR